MRARASTLTLLAATLAAVSPAVAHGAAADPARGLELVSPADSKANDILPGEPAADGDIEPVLRSTVDGDAAIFQAYGGLTGAPEEGLNSNPYVARRTPQGWVSRYFGAPATRAADGFIRALSDDFGRALVYQSVGRSADPDDPEDPSQPITPGRRLILQDAGRGTYTRLNVGTQMQPAPFANDVRVFGWTPGFSKVLFYDDRVLENPGGTGRFYVRDGTTTTRVPLDGNSAKASADLTRIYGDGTVSRSGISVGTVLAWLGGGPPVDIGIPRRTTPAPTVLDTAPAAVVSVSSNGSSVLFTTVQPLLDEDNDTKADLYEYELPSSGDPAAGSLRLLSEGAPGGADAEPGFVAATSDHARIYFVTDAALTPDAGSASNLYLREQTPSGPAVRLVATLAPDEASTIVRLYGSSRTRMTADGRILVFESTAPIGGATGGDRNIFRYDAGSGQMTCATCLAGRGPGDSSLQTKQGDVTAFTESYLRGRNLTSDGAKIYFNSLARLTGDDTNDKQDVYEYDASDGEVRRISTGLKTEHAFYFDSDATGKNVFFLTRQTLVPQDRNGDGQSLRLYDARVGGGFAPGVEPAPCAGDACRGPLYERPRETGVSSGAVSGPGDPPVATVPKPKPTRVANLKVRSVTAAQRRRLVRSGRLELSVSGLPTGTSVTATASAVRGKRLTRLGTGTRKVKSSASARVSLKLSARGRAQVRSGRALRVRIVVRASGAKRTAQTSFSIPAER